MYDLIKTGMDKLGIELSEKQINSLVMYSDLLVEWNKKINLTSITDKDGILTKHFLDSATPLLTNHVGENVIDVGTGAGFPGLVLKIIKPEIKLTLLDSLNKRLTFLQEVCTKLNITNVTFVHSRAEDGGQNILYREKYDTVVSRAVANMRLLSELCIPYTKKDGYFLALKGPSADEELKDSKRAISILGGEISETFSVDIPFTDFNHKIVIIKKVRHTPMRFPRKPSYISRNSIESCYQKGKKLIK